MIKTQLAPGLRSLGFKGSGRNYELPDPDYWAMLGFQASMYSDRMEVRFAINLLVVSRETWERETASRSYLGAKPGANWGPGPFAWWERLGILMPDGGDKWWRVKAGQNTDELARELIDAIERYGLPAMRARMSG
jgi:Domain of unknown function (DUF4304)